MEPREEAILGLTHKVTIIAKAVAARHPDIELDDLMSDGWEGAISAVDRYDPQNSAGASLGTFAGHRIRGAILDGMRARDYLRIGHRRAIAAGRRPPVRRPISLDELVGADEDDEGFNAAHSAIDLAASRSLDDLIEHLSWETLMVVLTPRQAFVIRRVYWDDSPLVGISKEMGVTPERVHQIKRAAEKMLRESLVSAGETRP